PADKKNTPARRDAPRRPRPHTQTRLRHSRVPQQHRLDLPRLNAEAANLNLLVRTPHKLQNPIAAPARQVPAAVHPAPRSAKAVRNKALPRQTPAPNIAAPNPSTRDVKLPDNPNRNRLQTTVQYINPRVPDRTTKRDLARAIVTAWPIGHVDGSFGWTVKIFHAHVRQQRLDLVTGLSQERLAATDETANGCASLRSLICHADVEHRRHELY